MTKNEKFTDASFISVKRIALIASHSFNVFNQFYTLENDRKKFIVLLFYDESIKRY